MKLYPTYLKFWFWWIMLTAFYLAMFLSYTPWKNAFENKFIVSVGLFVPFGVLNTWVVLLQLFGSGTIHSTYYNFGVFAFILLVILLFTADKIALRLNIKSPVIKIIFNLVILLILTAITDLLIWRSWASMLLFFGYPFKI